MLYHLNAEVDTMIILDGSVMLRAVEGCLAVGKRIALLKYAIA
jgi:hypothetical protein